MWRMGSAFQEQSVLEPSERPKVSVIPIDDFTEVPHLENQFVTPQIGGNDLNYSMTVQDFQQFDRVVVIITNIAPNTEMGYDYEAQLDPQ